MMIPPPLRPLTLALADAATVRYKIWIAIERQEMYPDGREEHEDVGLPDPIGVFPTLAAAQHHLRHIPGWEWKGGDHGQYQ